MPGCQGALQKLVEVRIELKEMEKNMKENLTKQFSSHVQSESPPRELSNKRSLVDTPTRVAIASQMSVDDTPVVSVSAATSACILVYMFLFFGR